MKIHICTHNITYSMYYITPSYYENGIDKRPVSMGHNHLKLEKS